MEKTETMPLGVVVERRRSKHPWGDYSWKPVSVIPGAPPLDPQGAWTQLRAAEDWVQFHCGTLPLELFRAETEDYKINLSQTPPRVFVVLRNNIDPDIPHDFLAFLVTASPFEAQHYLDSGEEIVEPVVMPEEVLALLQDFVAAHHVEETFTKRARGKKKIEDEAFSRRPPVEQPPGKRPGRPRADSTRSR